MPPDQSLPPHVSDRGGKEGGRRGEGGREGLSKRSCMSTLREGD